MKYALLIYGDEAAYAGATPEQLHGMEEAYGKYAGWLEERGWTRAMERLHDSGQATTVRAPEGTAITTDGPFAETKEALGGFFVIETADLDEAIEAAAACPGALTGSIEIRPIADM
ncbi:MAG: YciI family protein [Actinomycetota bacterium]